jgi:hypothetical protein
MAGSGSPMTREPQRRKCERENRDDGDGAFHW